MMHMIGAIASDLNCKGTLAVLPHPTLIELAGEIDSYLDIKLTSLGDGTMNRRKL
jgi:hypothetical protein